MAGFATNPFVETLKEVRSLSPKEQLDAIRWFKQNGGPQALRGQIATTLANSSGPIRTKNSNINDPRDFAVEWFNKWKESKTPTPATPIEENRVINVSPSKRIAAPVEAVETTSPAYKKGGLVKAKSSVRGYGKAVKGHGKGRVY